VTRRKRTRKGREGRVASVWQMGQRQRADTAGFKKRCCCMKKSLRRHPRSAVQLCHQNKRNLSRSEPASHDGE